MYPLRIKEKYDQNNLNLLGHRFTVVYLWNYKDWDYTEYAWSHPWVDIVPVVKNQDVLAVLDWKVSKTWEDWAYWKFVIIEHSNVPDPDDFTKTTTLYSCYEHLSQINVNIWDFVKEWDIIWKTWNTWNSFWEHLHFQIDRVQAPFHPYWPFTWAEAKAAWTSFTWWVNMGLWLDKAKMYTVNPLVYLDRLSANKVSTQAIIKEVKEETIRSTPTSTVTPITTSNTTDSVFLNSLPKVDTQVKETSTPVKEEKIDMISFDNNLVSDPTLDALSFIDEDKKKTLGI